jgi:hypothetical protein
VRHCDRSERKACLWVAEEEKAVSESIATPSTIDKEEFNGHFPDQIKSLADRGSIIYK